MQNAATLTLSPTSQITVPTGISNFLRPSIAILCAQANSNYFNYPELDIYTEQRPISLFNGHIPVITHAPCAQWSRLHKFAHNKPEEKQLAWHCLTHVLNNGGIFEHPAGSHFFREANITPTLSIDLKHFGYPARKTTWLYFHKCKPIAHPITLDAVETTVTKLSQKKRSLTPHSMCEYLINCIKQTYNP